jgi:PAS domain S-box-containing protein
MKVPGLIAAVRRVLHTLIKPHLGLQVIGVATLMALLGGGVVGVVMTDRARSALREHILCDSLAAADLASALAASYMGEAQATSRELASRPTLQTAAGNHDFSSLNLDLERWSVQHPNLSAFITDIDGIKRATNSTDKSTFGQDRSAEDYFQGAITTGQPFLGAPSRSPVTNLARVPYAVPLRDEAGVVRGVLVVSIQLDTLSNIITSIHVGHNARASLIDLERAILLAHPDPSRILSQVAGQNLAALRMKAGERGVLEDTTSTGQPVLAAFAPVPGLAWGIMIQQPTSDAFVPLDEMASDAVRLVSATVALAIALGVALALRIGRPLRRLRITAEAMAGGDLDRRAGLDRQDEAGELGRAFDHMADRLQASIRRANEREAGIRAVMDSVADAIVTFDEGGAIDSCNLAAERLFGYTAAEMVGQSIGHLVPEAALDAADSTWFASFVSGQSAISAGHECEGHRQDGAILSLEIATSETWLDGRRRVIVVARDIAERKHLDRRREALAQSEKLRALGQMATGIAHDLNQSLMLVASYSDLAREALERDPPVLDELKDLFTTATQAALDGGETVKRLLLFTRAPVAQDRRLVDLTTVVRDAAQLTAPRWRDAAQAEGRPISLHVEAVGHPTTEGSPARIREVLTNLIFNSVDALPTGGKIRLRVVAEGGSAVVEVIDSGLGMSAKVQARVFEPFFTTKGDGGTGLGLAMVFGIIEQHGGHIGVQSVLGSGTTFRMSLPLVERAHKAEPVPTAPADLDAVRPLRVLTVDDEPAMTRAVVRMLRPAGHVVTVAQSGEEALVKLAATTYDVVVSDMGMGDGMNGWDLAAEVRRRWPEVRFILATGWGAAIDLIEARSKGVEAVLSKPYLPAELHAVLAESYLAAV